MIKHYFIVAFRNLLRYKVQTTISIVGLIIGFTCFSLSMFWLQYENSYDDFHSKADRIYVVQYIDSSQYQNVNRITSYPLANYLKTNFPEIEEATATVTNGRLISTAKGTEWFIGLSVDSSFTKIFDLSDKNIRMPYYYGDNNSSLVPMPEVDLPIVITSNAAKRLFGNESSIDKEVKLTNGNTYRIEKEVQSWGNNSSEYFDFLLPYPVVDTWNLKMYYTYVLLKPGIDVQLLNEKLKNSPFGEKQTPLNIVISPLRTFNIDYPSQNKLVKYDHIRLFSLSGSLIAFCTFFNYIMLFISRIKLRSRELALRKVNGASDVGLLSLLYTEFVIILLCTLVLGFTLIHFLLPEFRELSNINLPSVYIYLHALKYISLLTIIILLISAFPIYYYQRKTLYSSIYRDSSIGHSNLFYKVCVSLQMIVSIGFIFCTLILIKQTNLLINQDVGFDKQRVAQVSIKWKWESLMPYADKIAQIPSVEKVLKYNSIMIWSQGRSYYSFSNENRKSIGYENYDITPEFVEFFDLKIIKGRNFDKDKIDKNEVIINETAEREFSLTNSDVNMVENKKVIGVVKDFCVEHPEMEIRPIVMERTTDLYSFVYRYKEGQKEEAEKSISRMIHNDNKEAEVEFKYMEDTLKNYYSSENALLKILMIMAVASIAISFFGVYSMVALICTKRRKEIAIRKVNGATISSILSNLIKEYLVLLLVSAIIILPVCDRMMSLWLENYVHRTGINWWLHGLIILGAIIVVTITVFSQVWRAANMNPAEVLKSE
ncbi:MAG: ABC transporter permease [Dysgonomonas sp.]